MGGNGRPACRFSVEGRTNFGARDLSTTGDCFAAGGGIDVAGLRTGGATVFVTLLVELLRWFLLDEAVFWAAL